MKIGGNNGKANSTTNIVHILDLNKKVRSNLVRYDLSMLHYCCDCMIWEEFQIGFISYEKML